MNHEDARSLVLGHLRDMQDAMNADGSGLPDGVPDRTRLVISGVEEHDVGWVFFYDSEEHQRTGDTGALAGNAPLIVDRLDGSLHTTGTAYGIEHYLEEYRRHRVRDAIEPGSDRRASSS